MSDPVSEGVEYASGSWRAYFIVSAIPIICSNRLRIRTQTTPVAPSILLRRFVQHPVRCVLLPGILPVPPGQTGADHGKIDVLALVDDLADDPLIAISLVPLHVHSLAGNQVG